MSVLKRISLYFGRSKWHVAACFGIIMASLFLVALVTVKIIDMSVTSIINGGTVDQDKRLVASLAVCELDKAKCLGALARLKNGDIVLVCNYGDYSYVVKQSRSLNLTILVLPTDAEWRYLAVSYAEQFVVRKPSE